MNASAQESPALEELERITDTLYDEVFAHRKDLDFYLELARRYSTEGVIIEAGCGTGRVSIPLAKAGHDVIAFDTSASRINQFRCKLAAEPPFVQNRLTVVQGDMRSIQLDVSAQLLVMPFRSFQHLVTPADQWQALNCLTRYLRPRGRLLIDIFNPSIPMLADSALLAEFETIPETQLADGRRVQLRDRIISRNYFSQTQKAEEIYVVADVDGRTRRFARSYETRFTFRDELAHLLRSLGLTIEEVWGDFDFRAFGTNYPGELLMLAQKPPGWRPVPPPANI